jgi:hexosaminidase
MIRVLTLLLALLSCYGTVGAWKIIPLPNHYEELEGSLRIPGTIRLTVPDVFSELADPVIQLADKLLDLRLQEGKNGLIRLEYQPTITGKESYRLTVGPHDICIEAGHIQGCFYGMQSALQLISSSRETGKLTCVVIEDTPRYSWRGLMLDESRHFMGKEEVKRLLDWMALHKLNTFHWHLTDSPGWRVEVVAYTLLTTIGARGNHSDPDAPVAFYSREDIRELVDYAAQRYIQVIPEIDMPGHATAAVRAYPEFGGGGSKDYPQYTFHPGKDETYDFLTAILREMSGLFPSSYIHVGGDEVHFGNEQWNELPEVRRLMEEKKLNGLPDVEHYFLNRMADSIRGLGKMVIGWDEVVQAGLDPTKTLVMWWRQEKPAQLEEALDKGYQVVLCPRLPLYFDFVQQQEHQYGRRWPDGSYAPLERVYRFPVPEMTSGIEVDGPLIRGIQANVWTEVIHTPERLQFMVFPRISALAEAAWTQARQKDFAGFLWRMEWMMELYRRQGISYYDYRYPDRTPEISGPSR